MTDQTPPKVDPPATPPTPPATPPVTPPATPPTPPTPPATPPEVIDDKEEPTVIKTEDDTPPATNTEGLDMLDPKNVEKVVNQTVEARLGKVRESLAEQRISTELNAELAAHPEYKPYEKRIRAWVTHPNRKSFIVKGFPVKSVILESIAPYLERIGAEKAKIAAAKAKATAGDGQPTPPPTAPTKRDVGKMTNAEVEQLAQDVKNGRVKSL